MPQYGFGTGNLYSTPVGGGAPLKFGGLQDVSIDISADIKTLHGQGQFPLAVARGKAKIEGKASVAEINADLYNNVFFSQTVASGQKTVVSNEAGAVPASVAYTVTVANGATFVMDLGVRLVTTGAALKQVASGPQAGEYSVSVAGVYTFNVAQASAAVLIDYIYTQTGVGKTISIGNALMGAAPTFQCILSESFQGKLITIVLYSCTSGKLSLPFKQDDFMIPEMDFQAQLNDAGQVGYISISG